MKKKPNNSEFKKVRDAFKAFMARRGQVPPKRWDEMKMGKRLFCREREHDFVGDWNDLG